MSAGMARLTGFAPLGSIGKIVTIIAAWNHKSSARRPPSATTRSGRPCRCASQTAVELQAWGIRGPAWWPDRRPARLRPACLQHGSGHVRGHGRRYAYHAPAERDHAWRPHLRGRASRPDRRPRQGQQPRPVLGHLPPPEVAPAPQRPCTDGWPPGAAAGREGKRPAAQGASPCTASPAGCTSLGQPDRSQGTTEKPCQPCLWSRRRGVERPSSAASLALRAASAYDRD
jgi:hypothetical protein